jgi:hypothetical protein
MSRFATSATRRQRYSDGTVAPVAALETTASLATAGGTLILAIATFGSIRSANRAARTAERALLAGLRPVIVSSRLDDPMQKVGFQDDKWFHVSGGTGAAEATDTAIYLVMSVRNVGSGMAVLHGWRYEERDPGNLQQPTFDAAQYHRLTRDIYVPPGDVGFWQGALRDPSAPDFEPIRAAIKNRSRISIELLYGDHEGGQRTITLMSMMPRGDDGYLATVGRHWNIDRSDPR